MFKEWRRKKKQYDKIGIYIYVCALLLTFNYYQKLFYIYNQNASLTMNQGLHFSINPNFSNAAFAASVDNSIYTPLKGTIVKSHSLNQNGSGIKFTRKSIHTSRGNAKVNIIVIDNMFDRYQAVPVKGHTSVKNYSKYYKGIAAINANYFKRDTRQNLGILMINKDIISGPLYERVAMGIGENNFEMARVKFDGGMTSGENKVSIDNVNQPRTISTEVLIYTKQWGKHSIKFPKYGMQLHINNNIVTTKSTTKLIDYENEYIIVGPMSKLNKFNVGDKVDLSLNLTPSWDVNHIISGGPYLVKEGQVYVDVKEEKLNSITGYNPRSAIGYTQDNKLILVAVDGRRENSTGVTLTQLAQFMKANGCYNAMNLDGGTSTQLAYNGKIVNNPLVRGGASVSSALIIIPNK